MEGDAEIYKECAPMLMRLATVLVGASDAPDVVADAVVRAIASPRWRAVGNRPGYLTRAVQNEARRKWQADTRRGRRERRAGSATFAAAPEPVDSDPEVLAAVRGLSARQRTVIILTYWDDMTSAAIAERIGISEGAVKRHLARARTNLRRVLDGPR